MSRKNYLVALSIILICILVMATACSSSNIGSNTSSSVAAVPQTQGKSMAYDTAANGIANYSTKRAEGTVTALEEDADGTLALATERKIVKHCYMSLETMEFDKALEDISQIIQNAGGYVQTQEVGGRSLYKQQGYYERNATIGARIPAPKLEEVTTTVGGMSNIVSKSENMDDITDQYYDAQARLQSLTLQEERLLEILSKAQKLEEVISLEQALSNVRYEIESITASLQRMDSQVTYSYLNLDICEVVEYNLIKNQPKNFWGKIQASLVRSGEKIAGALQGILFFVIEDLPVFVIIAVVFGGVLWIIILITRKVVARKSVKEEQPLTIRQAMDSQKEKKE